MTVQVGIDGFRSIADRSGTLAGIDDPIYDSEDTQHPNKATVTVHKMVEGQKMSFTASARWAEYAPTGSQAFMWNKMPYLMLGKCAEALALRKAFPNDLSGLYTTDEMAQANPNHETIAEYDNSPIDEDVDVHTNGDDFGGESGAAPSNTFHDETDLLCMDCDKKITPAERDWSLSKYGKRLCRDHQKTNKMLT